SDGGGRHVYRPSQANGFYAFVLEGDAEIADAILTRRDSIALEGEDKVEITARTNGTDLLLVETKL
ncbi:MAG TPA: pirin, partial [Reyranella sp.]|nr:pirin [Reyranella sp.]